jgi:arylsulfatase
MNPKLLIQWAAALCAVCFAATAQAAHKPNILFIVSDDTGYGDLGPYGGGEGRGMPTPNIVADRNHDPGTKRVSTFQCQPATNR